MNEDQGFSRFRSAGVIALLLTASAIVLLWGVQRTGLRKEADQRRAELEAGPKVRVATAGGEAGGGALELQGEAVPYVSTTVFAKVSGFLKEIRVDKGSRVGQGQLLALLESPELDRDAQALKADAENKRANARRLAELARQGIVSSRDLEDAEAQARIAQEKLASQAVLQGYCRVTAPFSGVVTQRFADPGALIQNGGNSASAQPLLSLAQVERLRVVFYLDQQVATRLKTGQDVEVRPADHPDRLRQVKVARFSGALDPRTRTLLAEADLDNRDGAFVAGGSVQLRLSLPAAPASLEIPSEAVLLKGDRSFAVVVGPDQKTRLRPILLGEDSGSRVKVIQGLGAGDRVVLNPPVTLQEGDRVQPVEVKF